MNHDILTTLYLDNEKLAGHMYNTTKGIYPYIESEQLLQECKLALWQAVTTFNPTRGKLSTHYYVVCKNHLINAARHWTNKFRLRSNLDYDLIKHKLPNHYVDKHYSETTEDIINILLNRYNVNKKNKEMFIEFYVNGNEMFKIAKRYGISRQAVSDILKRITVKMRRDKKFVRKLLGI